MAHPPYLPAMGRDWLLPFYDPFTRLLGIETSHRMLIGQAALRAGDRVLEIGCGTGSLANLAQRLCPDAQVTGLDPDPKALARARRKAERSGLSTRFEPGFAQELPYPDGSFDRVLSAFMLHHLPPDAKGPALREVVRVLKPGGSLHLADFDAEQHSGGLHARFAHSRHGISPHSAVLGLMAEAGFAEAQEVARQGSLLGQIVYYKAARPPAPGSPAA